MNHPTTHAAVKRGPVLSLVLLLARKSFKAQEGLRCGPQLSHCRKAFHRGQAHQTGRLFGWVAQRSVQGAHNALVAGSNPAPSTRCTLTSNPSVYLPELAAGASASAVI